MDEILTFTVGDNVQLKSGGNPMTVDKIDGDDIWCVWSDGNKIHREKFSRGTLMKYVPPRPRPFIFETI